MWATVPTTASGSFLQRIETTTGNFVGAASTHALGAGASGTTGWSIAGDLDANVTVSDIMYYPISIGGDLPSARTVKVGRYMSSNSGGITVGTAQGLAGQVIINANGGTDGWYPTVKIGPIGNRITLGPFESQPYQAPHYQVVSSSLGGGAVGLAPFQLHKQDCNPPSSTSLGLLGQGATIQLRHYGPVHWTSNLMPLTVEYYDFPLGQWIDITYDFEAAPGDTPRDVQITAITGLDFAYDVLYRIRPITALPGSGQTILKCSDVTGTPPVASYEYRLNW